MKTQLKTVVFAASFFLAAGSAVEAYAQRCGGDLAYIVRNKKGEIIDADKVSPKYVRRSQTENDAPTDRPPGYSVRESIKTLRLTTGCGLYRIELALESEGQTMLLRFHNLPMETNFYVDSLPFHEGTYEIDFKSDTGLKAQILDRHGLKTKAGSPLFTGPAKYNLLVSAKNWTKTSPSP